MDVARGRTHRSWLAGLGLILALALALSACGGDDGEGAEADDDSASQDGGDESEADAGEAADEGDVQDGGTLTIAVEADLRESDHLQARISVDKLIMGSTVYDALFSTDENGNPTPALVEEAEPSDDALEWTFHIREGVQFHNGKEFTAQDVVANLDAYLDPEYASNMAGDLENIADYEAVGDYEVRISLHEPQGRLPATFTDTIMMADMDSYDPENPVGTGPYQWESRSEGDNVRFSRFEDHWRGRPPLDEVEFRVIPDPQVALLELEEGNVDIVPNFVAPELIPGLRDNPDIDLYETAGNTIYQAFTNFEKARNGGYDDPEAFREGMAHLWNAQEIVPPIIGDFGELATQVIPPWQLGHNPDIEPWPYEPERGQELLAQAGVEEGDEIFLLVWNRPFNCDHATAFGSQLDQLGYEARVECLEPEAAEGTVQAYEWDLLFARTSGRADAATMFNDRWRKSLAIGEGTEEDPQPDDFYTMIDDELQGVIDEMLAATDEEEYERLGQRANEIIVEERIGMLPGYFDKAYVAARTNVEGIKLSGTVWYGMLMNEMTTVGLEN